MSRNQHENPLRKMKSTADQQGSGEDNPKLVALPRDIRAKRPYVVSLLLRMEWIRRASRVLVLMSLDLAGLFLAIMVALVIKQAILVGGTDLANNFAETKRLLPFAFLVTALLFARNGLYGVRETRPGLSKVVSSLTLVTVVALVFALVNGKEFSSYYIFYGSLFFGVIFVSALRWAYEAITGLVWTVAGYKRNAVLVGKGSQIESVARVLLSDAPVRYARLEYISEPADYKISGLRNLGSLEALPRRLDENQVDEVIITDPDFPPERAVVLVDECHRRGIDVRVAPTTMEMLTTKAEFVPGQSLPLFAVRPPVFEGWDFIIKRSFDLLVSSVLIVLISPLLLLIALMVKLTSTGPVVFRSRRAGIGMRTFDCLKFRTMYSDAEERQAEVEHLNETEGAIFKVKNDPRLTPAGMFLRRFSLDELPQLFNVIKGEMSLVGPRPLPMRDFDRMDEWHKKRYLVLPGITGLWQVSGRSELNFDEMVRLDFLYLEQWNVFLDLSILVKTVPAVTRRRGAF